MNKELCIMLKFKKLAVCVLAFCLALSMLVGCGGKGTQYTEDGRIIITFAGRGKDAEKNNFSRFLSDFMDSNEDIYVNLEWRANEAAHNSYLANSGMNNLPTIFMLDNRQFIPYADAGSLYDMKDSIPPEELEQIYYNSHDIYWWDPVLKLRGKTDNAALYGLPKDQGPFVLCYNKELYKRCWEFAYGDNVAVEYPSATDPMTFDEFNVLLDKLVPAGREGINTAIYGVAAYDLETAVNSNNASFFTGNDAKTANINTENFKQAIQFLYDLQKDGYMPSIATSSSGGYQTFCSGMSLFFYCGPWDLANFWAGDLSFEFDIMPVLQGTAEGAVATSRIGSMAYVVADCATAEEKEAAVRLARYLAVNESQQRTSYQLGQSIPNLKSMADEYIGDTLHLLGNKNPSSRGVFIDTVSGNNPKVRGKFEACAYTYSTSWLDSFNEYLRTSGVWTGADIGAALDAYMPTLQAALDQMQSMIM